MCGKFVIQYSAIISPSICKLGTSDCGTSNSIRVLIGILIMITIMLRRYRAVESHFIPWFAQPEFNPILILQASSFPIVPHPSHIGKVYHLIRVIRLL